MRRLIAICGVALLVLAAHAQSTGGTGVPGSGAGAGVTSLNTLTGGLTLAAGSNITITPSGGNTLTIAATAGSVSLTATTPVVVTPSPITGTGVLSCPTCTTSAASLASGNVVTGAGSQAVQDSGKALTGAGAAVVTGPTTSVSNNGVCFTGTSGQIQDCKVAGVAMGLSSLTTAQGSSVLGGVTAINTATLSIYSLVTTRPQLVLRNIASQTADQLTFQDSAGNTLGRIFPQAAGTQQSEFCLYKTLETTPTNSEDLCIFPDATNNVMHIDSLSAGTGTKRDISMQDGGGTVQIGRAGTGNLKLTGSVQIGAAQTTVNCSTSGSVVFSQPEQGTSYKVVMIFANACLGTASYTYPAAFTNTPEVLSQSLAAIATSVSTSAVTITGTTSTGFLEINGY